MTQAQVEVSEDIVRKLEDRLREVERARLEEANRLRIKQMAELVAVELGEYQGNEKYVFKGSNLVITKHYDGVSIHVGGKLVFYHAAVLQAYRPGTWVNRLINLYKAAKLQRAKRELAEKIEKLRREAENWGVSLEELLQGGE